MPGVDQHQPDKHCCFAHSEELAAFREQYRLDVVTDKILPLLNQCHASWVIDHKFDDHKHILEKPHTLLMAFVSQSCEAAVHLARGNGLAALTSLCNAAILHTFLDQHNDVDLDSVVDEVMKDPEKFARSLDDEEDSDE